MLVGRQPGPRLQALRGIAVEAWIQPVGGSLAVTLEARAESDRRSQPIRWRFQKHAPGSAEQRGVARPGEKTDRWLLALGDQVLHVPHDPGRAGVGHYEAGHPPVLVRDAYPSIAGRYEPES